MEKRQLEFLEVLNGKWSSNGNFLGECEDGTVIHIYLKQMQNLGYAKEKNIKLTDEVKLPLFVLAYNKQFINSSGENVIRLTAASVWQSYKELINGLVTEININT